MKIDIYEAIKNIPTAHSIDLIKIIDVFGIDSALIMHTIIKSRCLDKNRRGSILRYIQEKYLD